jgi:hypothetical protein
MEGMIRMFARTWPQAPGRRVHEHALEMTNKIKGKVTDTQQCTLSPDVKIFTIMLRPVG